MNCKIMKKHLLAFIGVGICGLILAVGVSFNISIKPQKAEAANRIISNEGDLYQASDVFGSKRLTNSKTIKMSFGEKNGLILVGKGVEGVTPGSESVGGTRLHLLRTDGTDVREVTADTVEYAFFDKKNDRLFYLTAKKSLYSSDITSGKNTLIASKVITPSISFDGNYVAYTKMPDNWEGGPYTEGALGIAVRNISTGEEHMITHTQEDYAPLWSPDGEHIVFSSVSKEGLNSLFVVDIDGSNRTQLTNIGQKGFSPDTVPGISDSPLFSTDGKYLVFESDRQIWSINLDLKGKKVISAKSIAYGVRPEWIEDGKRLSVVSTTASQGAPSLMVVDIDGKVN